LNDEQSKTRSPALQAAILSIGAELVSGLALDTHAGDISLALTALGIDVVRHETVDDDAAAIEAALRRAGGEVDLVVATGGLGPTLDDCTRDGLARAMGVPLEQDAGALAHLEAWAKARGRIASGSNLVQTMLPRGSSLLPNPIGTAVGIEARVGRARAFFMPGVPSEMQRMLADEVLPRLRAGQGERVTRVRTLRTFGLGESVLGEKLADLMARGRPTRVGTAVHFGMIDVHIYATGAPDEVEALLATDAAVIRDRLGSLVFGEGGDTIETAVAGLLASRHRTIALAESCTGGAIAARLVGVPGISAWLLEGIVAYSNASKTRTLGVPAELIREHGAVSEPVVRAMAEGARTRAGADLAVAVTGIAGPTGGTPEKPVGTVWTALADAEGTVAAREVFTGGRQLVRDRAVNYALNMVRLRLRDFSV
jgi:nicotinamide-nucleotide amidase